MRQLRPLQNVILVSEPLCLAYRPESCIPAFTERDSKLVSRCFRAQSTTMDYIWAKSELHSAFQLFCTQVIKQRTHDLSSWATMIDSSQTRIFGKVDGLFLHACWWLLSPILDAQALLPFGHAIMLSPNLRLSQRHLIHIHEKQGCSMARVTWVNFVLSRANQSTACCQFRLNTKYLNIFLQCHLS